MTQAISPSTARSVQPLPYPLRPQPSTNASLADPIGGGHRRLPAEARDATFVPIGHLPGLSKLSN